MITLETIVRMRIMHHAVHFIECLLNSKFSRSIYKIENVVFVDKCLFNAFQHKVGRKYGIGGNLCIQYKNNKYPR